MNKGIPFSSYAESQVGKAAICRSLSNFRFNVRKRLRASSVPSLSKLYLEEHVINY